MSLATNAIVSLGSVKSYLRISAGDTSQDEFLEFWINAVSKAIELHIQGPVVVQLVADEIHNGDGSSILRLDRCPVAQLATGEAEDVMIRSDVGSPWEILESDTAYIRVDQAEPWHISLIRELFPAGTANIKVSYLAGYTEIPGQIIRVAIEAVAEIFKESNQGAGRLGQKSRSIGGINSSGATDSFYDLSQRHRELLAPFVRVEP